MSTAKKDPLRPRAITIRAAVGLARSVIQPSLLGELMRRPLWAFLDTRHRARVAEYQRHIVSLEEVVFAIAGAQPSRVEELLAEAEFNNVAEEGKQRIAELGISFLGAGAHVPLLYVLCRLLRPATVVETGVLYGWSSAFILEALEKNGAGHLHSIDMPAFKPGSPKYTGIVVPERLKHRWTLQVGPQWKILPQVLSSCPSIDLFHYDSDKTYNGMLAAYSAVWPKLSPKGVLISDDLINDAFMDFAESQGLEPVVMTKRKLKHRIGLLVHP